jgi:methionyl-tRNA formyltransferase
MVRALQPWPGVVAPLAEVDVRLEHGAVAGSADGAAPGTVVRSEGESVVVAAREGAYRIDMITPPGKRAMSPAAFLRGRRHRSEAPAS